MGIRLDSASTYAGAVISPYYDSLLVKVSRTELQALRSLEMFQGVVRSTSTPYIFAGVAFHRLRCVPTPFLARLRRFISIELKR